MDITPGIYIIQNHADKSCVLEHPPQGQTPKGTRVEWPRDCRKLTLQWCLKPSQVSGSSTYLIQNVGTGQWLNSSGGPRMGSMDQARHWDLGSVKSGVGHIKVFSVNVVLSPWTSGDEPRFTMLETALNQGGHLWSFEKISDDLEEQSGQSPSVSQPQPSPPDVTVQPNKIIRKDSNSPYVDDTYFHTDMLFNMPRTPLTRIQRAAALEWVRKLGAANVPTMESFDECERTLEARQNGPSPAPRDTNPYGDDAHFYTYMLFNMPRATFTRTQRATALEWARRLGATNVPTIDSFDECERILDSEQSGGNNTG